MRAASMRAAGTGTRAAPSHHSCIHAMRSLCMPDGAQSFGSSRAAKRSFILHMSKTRVHARDAEGRRASNLSNHINKEEPASSFSLMAAADARTLYQAVNKAVMDGELGLHAYSEFARAYPKATLIPCGALDARAMLDEWFRAGNPCLREDGHVVERVEALVTSGELEEAAFELARIRPYEEQRRALARAAAGLGTGAGALYRRLRDGLPRYRSRWYHSILTSARHAYELLDEVPPASNSLEEDFMRLDLFRADERLFARVLGRRASSDQRRAPHLRGAARLVGRAHGRRAARDARAPGRCDRRARAARARAERVVAHAHPPRACPPTVDISYWHKGISTPRRAALVQCPAATPRPGAGRGRARAGGRSRRPPGGWRTRARRAA